MLAFRIFADNLFSRTPPSTVSTTLLFPTAIVNHFFLPFKVPFARTKKNFSIIFLLASHRCRWNKQKMEKIFFFFFCQLFPTRSADHEKHENQSMWGKFCSGQFFIFLLVCLAVNILAIDHSAYRHNGFRFLLVMSQKRKKTSSPRKMNMLLPTDLQMHLCFLYC